MQKKISVSAVVKEKIPRGELIFALIFIVVGLLLRIFAAFHYRIDSDEPQHLHVVHGWLHGLLPYRDVFDNHTPLFQLLWSPILGWIGDIPLVAPLMRLTVLPNYLLILWCVFRIGQSVFSRRVGLWAAVLAGFWPDFFWCSLEFRPDGLWAALWLVAIAIIVGGPLTRNRSFLAGLILGMALCVSMKTIVLIAALGIGGIVAASLAFQKNHLSGLSFSRVASNLAMALAGFALMPLAITLFFASCGALNSFYYGTIQFNLLAVSNSNHVLWIRTGLFGVILMAIVWPARAIFQRAEKPDVAVGRVLVFATTLAYVALLRCFWPILQREHFLPFYPLLFVLVTAGSFGLSRKLKIERFAAVWAPTALFAALELGRLVNVLPIAQNKARIQTQLLAEVLRLTEPKDWIMDLKGETIFRPRPFYYVLERIAKKAIKEGQIPDDIPERLIATGTCVAVNDAFSFPKRARVFLQENYLKVGQLRVAGKFLNPPETSAQAIPFDIKIPASYALVAASGMVEGRLDGSPYGGPRFLVAGHHEFIGSKEGGKLAVVWAQAIDRGFSPFNNF